MIKAIQFYASLAWDLHLHVAEQRAGPAKYDKSNGQKSDSKSTILMYGGIFHILNFVWHWVYLRMNGVWISNHGNNGKVANPELASSPNAYTMCVCVVRNISDGVICCVKHKIVSINCALHTKTIYNFQNKSILNLRETFSMWTMNNIHIIYSDCHVHGRMHTSVSVCVCDTQ